MSMTDNKPIRVLAADDSAVMRGVLRTLFSTQRQRHPASGPAVELCGVVHDGLECLSAVIQLRPDVLVLDLEMPRMHGLEVLERLRIDEPGLPVIMCSAYTESGARSTLEALALGAADYLTKPSEQSDFTSALETLAGQLMPKIIALAGRGTAAGRQGPATRPSTLQVALTQTQLARENLAASICALDPGRDRCDWRLDRRPAALEALLPKLAADFPVPIMIVQHMPKLFTGALAERLDRCCALRVREAFDGAELAPGTIWLAPGDAHMEVARTARPGEVRCAKSRRPEAFNQTPSAAIAESLQAFGGLPLHLCGKGLWRGHPGPRDDGHGFGRADRRALRASCLRHRAHPGRRYFSGVGNARPRL